MSGKETVMEFVWLLKKRFHFCFCFLVILAAKVTVMPSIGGDVWTFSRHPCHSQKATVDDRVFGSRSHQGQSHFPSFQKKRRLILTPLPLYQFSLTPLLFLHIISAVSRVSRRLPFSSPTVPESPAA